MFKKLEIRALVLLGICSLIMVSCGDESKRLDTSFFGYEYFPMETGKYWIYKVDEQLIRNNGTVLEENSFFLREDVIEEFVDVTGDTIYKIQRSISDQVDGNFNITDIWTSQTSENAAYRTEENLRFNKMIFPLNVGSTWQGNLFDELTLISVADVGVWVYKGWSDYEVKAKGVPVRVEGVNYSDVVHIAQANLTTQIEQRIADEYYANGVGLIQKTMTILDSQCDTCEGQTWLEKAEAGFTWTQTLVETN